MGAATTANGQVSLSVSAFLLQSNANGGPHSQKAVHRSGGFQKSTAVPDKPLPPGYTCHRCGEKGMSFIQVAILDLMLTCRTGHWIQACPTNTDPNFDGRPKFRRTTGIPRSFLKVVEKPTALADDGTVDVSKLPAGVMYTSTGEWVVAEPDKAAWDQFQAKAKASAEKAEALSTDNKELQEEGLECSIDRRMFVDPVKTPCCGQTYCRDCIENALLSNDFICPGCSTDNVLVDNLIADDDAVAKIKAYENAKKQAKEEKAKSPSPALSNNNNINNNAESPAGSSMQSPSKKSPTPARAATAAAGTPQPTAMSDSKKRPAEDDLENKRIPTGPAAMRKEMATPAMNGIDPSFIAQMNAMASSLPGNAGGMNAFAFPPGMNGMGMPGMGMMGMPGMPGMPGMNMPMNPMMMNGMGGMPGMMPGMGMNMPMNNPMMGMNGGGFPGGGNNNNFQNQQFGNGNGNFNPMANGGGGNGYGGQQWVNNGQQRGGFVPNQMRTGMNGAGPGMGNGNGGGGDDGAYMRQPVNPNRGRRQRGANYGQM